MISVHTHHVMHIDKINIYTSCDAYEHSHSDRRGMLILFFINYTQESISIYTSRDAQRPHYRSCKCSHTHHVMHNHTKQNIISLERSHLSERLLEEKTRVCKSQFEKNENAMLADLMSGSFGIWAGTERIGANTNDVCEQRTPNLSIA